MTKSPNIRAGVTKFIVTENAIIHLKLLNKVTSTKTNQHNRIKLNSEETKFNFLLRRACIPLYQCLLLDIRQSVITQSCK